jgi:hypothetical protein
MTMHTRQIQLTKMHIRKITPREESTVYSKKIQWKMKNGVNNFNINSSNNHILHSVLFLKYIHCLSMGGINYKKY